ncbi:hypothetical protein F444_15031 [Phytophthora nicotianae P1976]|uniref:Uncharacterized protein n=1 Tax=Phytophthora nicotianae P1976 TaxID=1317066 RepID=A0A080ZNA3_PHYNI|nr:hypothetical protein F444_15031 [Phytophthora nicotianae P1976]
MRQAIIVCCFCEDHAISSGVDTEDDSDDLGFPKEERAGTQLQFVDDLLAKLAINEAVALKNLNRFDDDLMKKLRKNPS